MDIDKTKILTSLDRVGEQILASAHEFGLRGGQNNPPVGLAWDIRYSENVKSWLHEGPRPGFCGRVWLRLKNREYQHFGSDWLGNSRSRTGTGGFGGYNGPWEELGKLWYLRDSARRRDLVSSDFDEPCCFSWDYTILLCDWPGLQEIVLEEYETHRIYNSLKGTRNTFLVSHKFKWEDNKQVEKDQKFLEETKKLIEAGLLIIPKN